jgi:hypothetical protein
MHLLIYTPATTPRIAYVWELIVKYVLRCDFSLTDDLRVYRQADICKINYSNQRLLEQEVFLPSGNLLLQTDIRPQPIQLFYHQELPAFFQQTAPGADLPFDLPALVFYLVSRYEEYLPFTPDAHGRFPAEQSLAFRHGFLQQPLVNEWILRLQVLIQEKFPDLVASDFRLPASDFQFQSTYDLDLAWAYRHKGAWRSVGAYARDLWNLDVRNLLRRWRVQTNQAADPFFTFDYLQTLHHRYHLQSVLFVLLGDYGAFDKNTPPDHPAFRQLLMQLQKKYQLGIHPSYRSDESMAQLQKEVRRLEEITGEPVVRSRQHFLKLQFPQTYQRLLELSILADYSLGYASQIGFRASIATAYPWYDLARAETTPLLLHPFQVMDVALKEYLKLNPTEAVAAVQVLIERTRAVGGTFYTLWHNSSFSEVHGWGEWRWVYETILELAVRKNKLKNADL